MRSFGTLLIIRHVTTLQSQVSNHSNTVKAAMWGKSRRGQGMTCTFSKECSHFPWAQVEGWKKRNGQLKVMNFLFSLLYCLQHGTGPYLYTQKAGDTQKHIEKPVYRWRFIFHFSVTQLILSLSQASAWRKLISAVALTQTWDLLWLAGMDFCLCTALEPSSAFAFWFV